MCRRIISPKLEHRLEAWRRYGCFIFGVEDATLVEGEILGVTQRQPEKVSLHGHQVTVHPRLDAFDG
jgi:hypothetical protein